MTISPQFRHPIDATALAQRARAALPPDAPDSLRNLVDELGRAIGDRDRDLEDFLRQAIAAIVIPSGFPISYNNGRTTYSIVVTDAFVGTEDIMEITVIDNSTGVFSKLTLDNSFGFAAGKTSGHLSAGNGGFFVNSTNGDNSGRDGNGCAGVVFGTGVHALNVNTASTAVDLYHSNAYGVQLNASTTFVFLTTNYQLNPGVAQWEYTFYLRQDATGGRTVTWPNGAGGQPKVLWPGGVAPTLTAAANALDIIKLRTTNEFVEFYGTVVGLNYT